MSFAVSVVGDYSGYTENCEKYTPVLKEGYSPDFKISNEGSSKPINGFKIYAYFTTQDPNAQPALDPEKSVKDSRGVILQNMNEHVWRVVIDYTNKVIPAGGIFRLDQNLQPSIYSKYFKVVTKKDYTNNGCWEPYPWGYKMEDIVIESASGQVISGRHPTFKSLVGVLGLASNGCDDGKRPQTYIRLDEENTNNQSGLVEGYRLKLFNPSSEGAAWFLICPVDARKLHRTPYDYMVFRLDEHCPDGTYPVKRHHDAEDTKTFNHYVGSIWPNKVGKDVDLEFCFVPRVDEPDKKFPFGTKYGVFANPDASIDPAHVHYLTQIKHGKFFIDDEDTNNQNKWDYYGLSEKNLHDRVIITSIKKIMHGDDGDKNTYYHVIGWGDWVVPTNAKVAHAGNILDETPLVTAMPLAPVFKGLSHSAVAVELKSAGDTKVSIVGINGAVVANTAEKNLQPGVHQIKLNSGIIPNGRYVVKIEQNGMVDAKNVILK